MTTQEHFHKTDHTCMYGCNTFTTVTSDIDFYFLGIYEYIPYMAIQKNCHMTIYCDTDDPA